MCLGHIWAFAIYFMRGLNLNIQWILMGFLLLGGFHIDVISFGDLS